MTGRWARAVTLIIGVAAVASACSGSDESTPSAPLESSESITAPPPTDASVATTDGREVDELPTTVATTTSSTTTTTAPAPTTTTLDDLRAEIEADLNEGEQALISGGATPGDPAAQAELARYFAGGSLEVVLSFYEQLSSRGHLLTPNEDVSSTTRVLEVLSSTEGTATIRKCRIDAAVTVTDSTTAPEVIDDSIVRYDSVSEVVLTDGTWRLSEGETLVALDGVTTCE